VPVSLKPKPTEPQEAELKLAYKIVSYAHDTTTSLLDGFRALRANQRGGTSTDEQQDLLRAMLLFAGAGLDSSVKQIIEDAMPRLALHREAARSELQKFATRRLRRADDGEAATGLDAAFLAEVLVGDTHVNLIEAFKEDLTGNSLQSIAQINRVAAALGIAKDAAVKDAISAIGNTFQIRNEIAHRMDINFGTVNRNRNGRKRDDMVRRTNALLAAADSILTAVDGELAACPRA
jgi:hypothetical protein